MTKKAKLLLVSALVMVVGIFGIFFFDTKGPEPKLVCAPANGPTSGFSDSSQGDCPVSIESYNTWREWRSGPNPGRIAGLGIAVIGLISLIAVAVAVKPKKPADKA